MDEPPYTCETSELMNQLDMGEMPETPAKEQGYSPLDAASCSGGFCWCDMCGYNATLTARMLEEWDRDHEDPQAAYHRCPDCHEMDMDSILKHGPHLPDHIAEDDPMLEHGQNDERSNREQ